MVTDSEPPYGNATYLRLTDAEGKALSRRVQIDSTFALYCGEQRLATGRVYPRNARLTAESIAVWYSVAPVPAVLWHTGAYDLLVRVGDAVGDSATLRIAPHEVLVVPFGDTLGASPIKSNAPSA